jgi:hypothetical protein
MPGILADTLNLGEASTRRVICFLKCGITYHPQAYAITNGKTCFLVPIRPTSLLDNFPLFTANTACYNLDTVTAVSECEPIGSRKRLPPAGGHMAQHGSKKFTAPIKKAEEMLIRYSEQHYSISLQGKAQR